MFSLQYKKVKFVGRFFCFRGDKMQLPPPCWMLFFLHSWTLRSRTTNRGETQPVFTLIAKDAKCVFFCWMAPIQFSSCRRGGRRVGIKFREQSSLPESAAQEWGKIETDAPYFRFFCAKTRVVVWRNYLCWQIAVSLFLMAQLTKNYFPALSCLEKKNQTWICILSISLF